MSDVRRRNGRRIGSALVAAGIALAVLIPAAPAAALPPDGAGPDTPGTSSSVSPSTLQACQTLKFTVSGYPAGETLYVKIDDGIGYGDTSVQGSGVWHMQAIPASGTVNGSFELPCGIAVGSHWLRFLASEELHDANGTYQGVLGYTRRGGTDFTVVAGTGGSSNNSGGSGGGTQNGSSGGTAQAPAAGTTVGTGAESLTGQGGVLSIEAAPGADAEATTTPTADPEQTAQATTAPIVEVTAAEQTGSFPVVGAIGGGVLLLVGGTVVWLLLRKRTAPPAS